MNPDARIWDRIAERYSRKPVPDQAVYQRKLEITRTYLRPDMDLLEIGCGTGSTAIAHAPYVRRVRATDLSPRMIEIARDKVAAAGMDNVACEVAGADAVEAPDASVDAVLALSLLHLVIDRDATLARIHRMLKPDGLLVASTPCLDDFARWFRLVGPLGRRLGLIPGVRSFTRLELEASLEAAGFSLADAWQPSPTTGVFHIAIKAEPGQ